jgi:hypothetical protein
MEFLAQIGYFGEPNLQACSLYGLIMMIGCVFMAFTVKKPNKND